MAQPDKPQSGKATELAAALAEPLHGFIRYLASEKRHSPHTCSNYEDDLRRLGVWVAGDRKSVV